MNNQSRCASIEKKELKNLARLIESYTPHDGTFNLAIKGVKAFRSSFVDPTPISLVSQAGLCIVAQGTKRVLLGRNVYEYNDSHMAIYTMALPIEARVIEASRYEPYLCLIFDITPQKISELTSRVFPHGTPKTQDISGIHVGHSDEKIVSAAIRLMEAMQSERESNLFSDIIVDEIFIRLLSSPVGPAIAQIGMIESTAGKIVKAISWLRENYTEPLHISKLSSVVNMSDSSFHRHFKSITLMTPLQFQKALRLQEAKNLILTQMLDVTTASLRVGYTSTSQFSREYRRFFGNPPTKDTAKF